MSNNERKISKDMPPAIVLGMSPTGLAVIRGLGRRGIEVWGNDIDWYRAGFFSKYCKKLATLNPLTSEPQLLECLLEFGVNAVRKPVIFPTDDEYLVFLANNREVLQRYFCFPNLDLKIIEQFLNKWVFHELCQRHRIATPITYFVRDEGELRKASEKIAYPAIIKPIYSHIWALKYGFLKVIEVHSSHELLNAYNTLGEMKSNVMLQEVIGAGDDQLYIFSGYFNEKSEPLGIFTGRKLRQYPASYGTTTVAVSVWEPKVAELSVRFLQQIKFHGLCDVEFKKDPIDGQFKMIEINPRVGRWHSLTDASGADLTYTAYLNLIGEKVKPKNGFQEDIKWVFLFRDVVAVLPRILSGDMSFVAWRNSISGVREHAIYSWEDLMPSFAYVNEMLIKGFQGLRRGSKLFS